MVTKKRFTNFNFLIGFWEFLFQKGEHPNLSEYDCNAVGGVLKAYLRELPIPLVIMTQGLKEASGNSNQIKKFKTTTKFETKLETTTKLKLFRQFFVCENRNEWCECSSCEDCRRTEKNTWCTSMGSQLFVWISVTCSCECGN